MFATPPPCPCLPLRSLDACRFWQVEPRASINSQQIGQVITDERNGVESRCMFKWRDRAPARPSSAGINVKGGHANAVPPPPPAAHSLTDCRTRLVRPRTKFAFSCITYPLFQCCDYSRQTPGTASSRQALLMKRCRPRRRVNPVLAKSYTCLGHYCCDCTCAI